MGVLTPLTTSGERCTEDINLLKCLLVHSGANDSVQAQMRCRKAERSSSRGAHLSWGFSGEGSAEEVRLLDWLLWRDPLCEEPEREAARRKGCAKNSSKVRRSTGLRRSRPYSSATQEADSAFLMGSGICASCRSIARSSATWLAPLKGGLPAGMNTI